MFDATGDAWYHAMALGSLAWAPLGASATRPQTGESLASADRCEIARMRDIATTHDLLCRRLARLRARDARCGGRGHVDRARSRRCARRYGVEPPAGLSFLVETQRPVRASPRGAGAEALRSAAFERGRRLTLDEALDLVGDARR